MRTIYTLNTNRSYYDINEAADDSLTVGALIDELRHLDPDARIVFSNDNGYSYGYINYDFLGSENVQTPEEQAKAEALEELENELYMLREAMEELEITYQGGDEEITEQEYDSAKMNYLEQIEQCEAEIYRLTASE